MPLHRITKHGFLCAGLISVLLGCAQTRPFDDLWVDRRPYQADTPTTLPPREVMQGDHPLGQAKPIQNPDGSITLRDAVILALAQNPSLNADGWAVAAAEADALQRARPRNPTATLSVENFGQPDNLSALPRQTLRISQVIELADKREKRLKLGQAEQRLKAWDYEQQRIEIAATTATRYVAVVVAQSQVVLAKKQLKLAEAAYTIADDRASTGTRPGYERDQAASRVALSQIELEQANRDLAQTRADLANAWGAEQADFINVDGDLAEQVDLPSLESLQNILPDSPHLARWDDEIAQRERAIDLARANGVTDPTVGGGVRYLSELDETVGVAEVSWPLPLLDRNEHGILAARLRLSQARAQKDAAYAEINRQLSRTYAQATAATNTMTILDQQAIPAAQAAYDATRQAYEAGQTDYLIALEAERSLLELKSLKLQTALTYHTAIIDLEHITANPLNESP